MEALSVDILLDPKEKALFDLLSEDLQVLDVLNIVNQFAMIKNSIKVNGDTEDIEDDEEEEPGKMPGEKPGIKAHTVEVIPGYDRDTVVENKIMYG